MSSILDWCSRICRRAGSRRERLHDEGRTIFINQRWEENKFPPNRISTSKYSLITFLPKFLWEQFRKYSNIFFLFIVVIQQLPEVSPTGRFTTAVPLTFILFCAALKEIIEDVKRHIQDGAVNSRKVHVFESGRWVLKAWRQVKVGDFVEVRGNEDFPADLLFLSSSESNSICYIETSNLDGETNLKVRQSLPQTAPYKTIEELRKLVGTMECDLPNRDLYEFSGTLKIEGVEHPIPVNIKQILLRGSKLKNTKHVFGLVIYTGHDTKLMLNSSAVPSKQTNVERQTNRQILLLLGLLLLLCVFSTIIGEVWTFKSAIDHWYLGLERLRGGEVVKDIVFNFLTFFILYNNLIPISLQITVDLVKFIQALFINWDREMYDEETDTPANARTSNLNEELGQVKYIFSDKTGTLTRNEMVFKQCSIAGIKYGSGNVAQFNGAELVKNLKQHDTRETIREFLTVLATCHTVVAETTQKGHYSPTAVTYQASSPDECALVNAAREIGVVFYCRKPDSVLVNFLGKEEEYEILNVLEFTSDRKRMTVIIRTPDGKIKLYCKGADNIIMDRLGDEKKFVKETSEHLESFAQDGLRTLCFAYRELAEEEYQEWAVKFLQASTTINNRNELVAEVSAKIEQNLHLLGATGIEDRLQDQVPESLSMLLRAGIKVWVLTGDKKETAINIGFSCRLLSDNLDNYIIDQGTLEATQTRLKEIRGIFGRSLRQDNPASLIIDGKTLSFALTDDCRTDFLDITLSCRTVICCRVTPKQKAEVVELVKKSVKAITLAIGDGANDVGMIQMAHVGIGITGREGVQAACASDYSIGQFRFLTRLLFVHGVWNYRRLCKVLLYSFYKNICLYVMELWFAFHNGFSGQILFERWTIGLYNVIFTAAPPMALGLLDRCSTAKTMMSFPAMYHVSQSGTDFNNKIFWTWTLNAMYHSIILYFMSYAMLRHDVAFKNGQVGDYVFLGNMIYTYVVFVVCLKAGLESDSWTWLTHLAIWGSIVSWFLFLSIYSFIWPHLQLGPEMQGMATHVFASGYFWFSLLLIPSTALLLDFIYAYIQRTFCKTLIQAVHEKEVVTQDLSEFDRNRRLSTIIRMTERLPILNRLTRKKLFGTLDSRYQGYAFSQEERGDVPQSQLIRQISMDQAIPAVTSS